MLSIYEDGVSITPSLLSLLNHILIGYILEASRVIGHIGLYGGIVLHLAGPIILFEPGTACSF